METTYHPLLRQPTQYYNNEQDNSSSYQDNATLVTMTTCITMTTLPQHHVLLQYHALPQYQALQWHQITC